MSRVAVTTEDGRYAGHFDWDKAGRWSDRGGAGYGEAVMLTAGGKWVLEHWTLWQGMRNTYEWITAEDAQAWLIRNRETEAVEEYFGDEPDEVDKRAGRPEIGGRVTLSLGADLLAVVDAAAAGAGAKRAEMVRELVKAGLKGEGGMQVLEFSYSGGTTGGAQDVVRQATPTGRPVPSVSQAGRLGFEVLAGRETVARIRIALEERGETCYVSGA